MCGLFGLIAFGSHDLNLDRARAARDRLAHRGPDQAGDFQDGKVFLGHRRLSILDLSENGRQPMISSDEAVVVTVNGEIYNFKTLRKELGEENFFSGSDSEVILHGYRQWGITGLLERIEGMFAIALYDREQQRVYLCRDRVGIKPLYFSRFSDCVAWGSELKALESYFSHDGRLVYDKTALYDFLTYRYIPCPKSLYQNVFKLEPAHYMEFDVQSLDGVKHCYWELDTTERETTQEEAFGAIQKVLDSSVKEQLISDVDVGFFLSGGIDSSAVVALASRHPDSARTYAIGFSDQSHDETSHAACVADAFNTTHTRKEVSPELIESLAESICGWYDEPFGDSSAWPTFEVSKLARESSVVALTGDGGDELFGGYRWYRAFNKLRGQQRPVSFLLYLFNKGRGPRTGLARKTTGTLQKIARRVDLFTHNDPLELYGILLGGVPWPVRKHYRALLGIPDDYDDQWYLRKHYRPELGPMKSLQYMDFHTYLPDDILTKVDRVSMAVSLETRVPFLDTNVIEAAFSLPEKVTYANGDLKGVLKGAFAGMLPESILERGKKGFSIPLHNWGEEAMEGAHTFQEYILSDYLDGK